MGNIILWVGGKPVRLGTKDAGKFEESKHKRDSDGKFSHSGGPAKAHQAAYEHHSAQAKAHPNKHLGAAHKIAAEMHNEALNAPNKENSEAAHEMTTSLFKSEHKPAKQEALSPRQAALREAGSPRYAGRTNPPEKPAPETEHPAASRLAAQLKTGLGEAMYKSERGGIMIKHYGDKDEYYRAGMMRSKTLSGLLNLIDQKVK